MRLKIYTLSLVCSSIHILSVSCASSRVRVAMNAHKNWVMAAVTPPSWVLSQIQYSAHVTSSGSVLARDGSTLHDASAHRNQESLKRLSQPHISYYTFEFDHEMSILE